MKKIMILGASILQVPAIKKAKEMGLQVIAVDMDRNAIGFRDADVCLAISTIDIPNVVAAAKEYQIDSVMTLASDMPMRTVVAVSKELGLVGIDEDTALKATDKAVMRRCLKEHNVPIPEFFRVSSYEEYIKAVRFFSGSFIVKPADNSGSRGVFKISSAEDSVAVEYAFEYSKKYSHNGNIVVEEFMEGQEVSVETISVDGVVHIIQITDKLTTGAPHFVEMGHSQPTCHSKEVADRICEIASAAVKAIGIKNGPSHTEIIVTKNGPKVVELGARLGGDCITTHLVPLSTGVDMVENCIRIALGERPDITPKFSKGSAIRYFESHAGILKEIYGVEDAARINGIKQVSIVHNIDEKIHNIESSSDRVGFVIAQGVDANNAVEKCYHALSKIKLSIE